MTAADPGLVEELALANRILFDQGVVDAFGHVSVRHDKRPDRYLLARSMAPALVAAADIMEFALDGTPVDPQGRSSYLERFIHGAIYAARPDVMSVIHSHSPAVVPFGVVAGSPLKPVCHMAGFLDAEGTPVFEIRDTAGPSTDLLIRTGALGEALAESLGGHAAVLMRGHGSTVVGTSLRQAVFRAVYLEVNAKLQAAALGLGPVTYLNADEARLVAAANDSQVGRAWDMWKLRVEKKL